MKALRTFLVCGVLLLTGCVGRDPVRPAELPSSPSHDQAPAPDSTTTYSVERGPNLMGSGNSSTIPDAGAPADTATTAQGISTLGSGN
jgi:hypothetical protein